MKITINKSKDALLSLLTFLIIVPLMWVALLVIHTGTIWSAIVAVIFLMGVGLFSCGIIVATTGTETTGNE